MDRAEEWRRGLTNFESHERLRKLVDAAPFMAWAAVPVAECAHVNQRWLDFTGTTLAEQLGDGWLGRIHPEDRERCRKTCFEKSRLREPFHTVYRLRRADGSYSWVLDESTPLWTRDGQFSGYAGTALVISDSKSTDVFEPLISTGWSRGELIRQLDVRFAFEACQKPPDRARFAAMTKQQEQQLSRIC